MESRMIDPQRTDPIFIHGLLPRSGTNFLWHLLQLHPDCAPAIEPVHEDLFLEHSDQLVAFARSVRAAWDPRWGEFADDLPARLAASLGDGLVSFLWEDRGRRLVTKSPSVRNLDRFFALFPTARLLVLVRDGRAVTRSAMETFGWGFERAARAWAQGADEIRRFRETYGDAHPERWRLVRYEALVEDLDVELPEVLRFLELDLDRYDMGAARTLPVRGSSWFFGEGRSTVHWEPLEKDPDFRPTERWRSWTPERLERFEWLAGDGLRYLGYGPSTPTPGRRAVAHQRLLDVRWAARAGVERARRRLAVSSRPLRHRLGLTR
jgi:protein-tyrosine sulfotransferase